MATAGDEKRLGFKLVETQQETTYPPGRQATNATPDIELYQPGRGAQGKERHSCGSCLMMICYVLNSGHLRFWPEEACVFD